jgi:hypothetical protein
MRSWLWTNSLSQTGHWQTHTTAPKETVAYEFGLPETGHARPVPFDTLQKVEIMISYKNRPMKKW